MKHKLFVWIAVMLAVLFVPCALADVVEPTDDFWYYDGADVLSEETEGLIFFANQQLYNAAGAEIVVVAVEDTGSFSTQDYAYTLFNEWGIGGENERGFLLLLSIEDDDYYGMLGTMLEPYFDSATVAEYLDAYLEPDFADKDYDDGVRKFFEKTYDYVVNALNLDLSLREAEADYKAYMAQNPVEIGDRDMNGSNSTVVVQQERRTGFGFNFGAIVLIVILIYVLSISMRSRRVYRSSARPTVFWPIFFRGAMRRPPHNPPPPRGFGGFGGPGHFGSGSRPGGSFGGNSRPGGFGGTSRSSGFGGMGGFGGASRGSAGRTSSRSGFGGASRSGGARGGTRGGGAGRGGRR